VMYGKVVWCSEKFCMSGKIFGWGGGCRRNEFLPQTIFSGLVGHNPKKSGKFLSATLIFSFPYAHDTESCYFIKQLLYGFRVWMDWSKHLGMLLELRKARKIAGRYLFCNSFLWLGKTFIRLVRGWISNQLRNISRQCQPPPPPPPQP
jgi:hypothetical protein